MEGEQKMIAWIVGIIAFFVFLTITSTASLYHWKKVSMARAGYEEVSVQKINELGWQKAK